MASIIMLRRNLHRRPLSYYHSLCLVVGAKPFSSSPPPPPPPSKNIQIATNRPIEKILNIAKNDGEFAFRLMRTVPYVQFKSMVHQRTDLAAMKEEIMVKVKITNKAHVKPKKTLGRKECQLVTFDLPYLAFYYNQKLLFYKGGDFEDVVRKLKNGLSLVLEEFYPLAGKLGKDEDGVFRIEYDDEIKGVEVSEAIADEIHIADLANAEVSSMLKHMVPYHGILNLEGLHRPLVAVQVTKLKDGIVIGCAFNHAVVDGTSMWHFMSSWAEICRGTDTVSNPPFLDRTKVRNTRVKLNLQLSLDPSEAPLNSDAKPGPQLQERIFKFSKAAIDRIKSMVNANPPSDGSKAFSTFQSLSTHIWRHVNHARKLKPEDYTTFTVFADCRKRVDPPMPQSYFGNLIQAVFTGTTTGQLMANPPDFGARLIQQAIHMHNAKAIDERCKAFENAPKIYQFKDAGMNRVAVGSSPRFKVYDIDFGWGKPERVRSGSNNRFDGMVYLHQGKSGEGSIDVDLCLEAGVMEELEKDKEFLMEV